MTWVFLLIQTPEELKCSLTDSEQDFQHLILFRIFQTAPTGLWYQNQASYRRNVQIDLLYTPVPLPTTNVSFILENIRAGFCGSQAIHQVQQLPLTGRTLAR